MSTQLIGRTSTRLLALIVVLLSIVAATALHPSAARAAAGTSTLYAGERLNPGQSLVAANSFLVLTMQTDGNLVLYAPGSKARWQSGTSSNPGAFAEMQDDGNFVVYTAARVPLWESRTSGTGADRIVLQDDGNLVVYAGQAPKFNTGTYYFPDNINADGNLQSGGILQSPAGSYLLKMQGDGNLVLYRADGQWVWHTNTAGQSVSRLAVQSDGNLVLYASTNAVRWNSGTSGHTGGFLRVQDDGNVVFYTPASTPIWDSQSATNITKAGGAPSDVSGQLSAQQLVASGRLTGGTEQMNQIRAVANGTTLSHVYNGTPRYCVLDPTLLQSLRQMVVDEGNSVYVSSFNRYCINELTESGTSSYHWRNGGGHAVDLAIINGATQAGQAAMVNFAQRWVNVTSRPAGIGQKQCRGAIALPAGVVTFDDTCNHLHLEYRG